MLNKYPTELKSINQKKKYNMVIKIFELSTVKYIPSTATINQSMAAINIVSSPKTVITIPK